MKYNARHLISGQNVEDDVEDDDPRLKPKRERHDHCALCGKTLVVRKADGGRHLCMPAAPKTKVAGNRRKAYLESVQELMSTDLNDIPLPVRKRIRKKPYQSQRPRSQGPAAIPVPTKRKILWQ